MDLSVLINALRAVNTPVKLKDGREVILVPDGYEPHVQPVAPPIAERIIAARLFHDGNSLAAYVNRFRQPSTTMIADIAATAITVAIDYHDHNRDTAGGGPVVGAVNHLARWELSKSQEFAAWSAFEGKLHAQEDFIRFLEENAMDVVLPDPAKLLDLCRDFEAIETVNFKASKRLDNGDREFVYSKSTGTAERISVPSKLTLSMPIFYGEQPIQIEALFRYRMREGGLQLGYEFHRIKPVVEAAFRSAAVRVADETGLPALFGKTF